MKIMMPTVFIVLCTALFPVKTLSIQISISSILYKTSEHDYQE